MKHFILISVLALSTCTGESVDDQTNPEIAAQIQLCEAVCLKPFVCDPTLEPGPDPDGECSSICTDTVAAAVEDECANRYQDFLECLDAASCEDFELWASMQAGAVCSAEGEALEQHCPGVEVRREPG